ncbi:MAG TPA: glycosyltransferase N-terminal domain-containing protein [Gemmatimonadaceae bacterium]|nr:glycosyltransferase N-terminal domain-containing protein [Gemmatimonadaceae bacterium]
MHPLLRPAYAGIARVAATLSEAKWLRALGARAGLIDRYRAWATVHRDTSRPLLWIHAPSVGEALQARPIVELIRSERPAVQIAFTYYSPSADRFSRSLPVDFTDYLPFDRASDIDAALDALMPSALVFSKLDVWPVLVERASLRGVRLGLLSATLSARSSRRSMFARAVLHDAYARLDAVGAIDSADARRLIEIGVRPTVIEITGDTRYDQVWRMAADAAGAFPELAGRSICVAGSTWPPDERVVLEGWLGSGMRLIVAPHEPTPTHVHHIETWAASHKVPSSRLSSGATAADLIIVDSVGVLARLYSRATVAYVGGGFGRAGLHSVLEPAAFGVPVLFGPRHTGSRDAGLLLAAGGGFVVRSPTEFRARLHANEQAGDAARETVRQGLGAARRSLALVDRLMVGRE